MLKIKIDHEVDGRRIGERPARRGVLAYGDTEAEACTNVTVLTLRVIADRS